QYQARLLDELRSAVRARDEFLCIASHELRTPLTTLQLQIELLARLAPRLQPTGRESSITTYDAILDGLALLRRQVERLENLVEGLLDVGRLVRGPAREPKQDVELAALARGVVNRLGDEQQQRGSELTVTAAGTVRGHWNPFLLERIVGNLIG